MKIVVPVSRTRTAVVDAAPPSVGDGEVMVRVCASGICGSDRRMLQRYGGEATCAWGHEIVGVVERTGSEVDGALLGRHVVLRTSRPCADCDECRHERSDKCRRWQRHLFNGFAEYVAIPAGLVGTLPLPIVPEYVLVEPIYVAMDLVRRAGLMSGETAMIVGAGPLGLLVLRLLRAAGTEVVVFAKRERSAQWCLAQRLGGRVRDAEELAHPGLPAERVATAIVTAPYEVLPRVIPWVAYGGTVVFNGFGDMTTPTIDMAELHTRRISLVPSFPHPQSSFAAAIDYVRDHAAALAPFVSHRVPIRTGAEAFDIVSSPGRGAVKVVMVGDEEKAA